MDADDWYPGKCFRPGQRGYTLEQGKMCVGRGWHALVERAFKVVHESGGCVIQVKEKFAALRVYASWGGVADVAPHHNSVYAELEAIEQESERTCERCGAPGSQVAAVWVKTLCAPHALKYLAGERFPSWETLDDASRS